MLSRTKGLGKNTFITIILVLIKSKILNIKK